MLMAISLTGSLSLHLNDIFQWKFNNLIHTKNLLHLKDLRLTCMSSKGKVIHCNLNPLELKGLAKCFTENSPPKKLSVNRHVPLTLLQLQTLMYIYPYY